MPDFLSCRVPTLPARGGGEILISSVPMAASGKWEIQVLVACVGFAIVGKTAFLLTVTVSQAGIASRKGNENTRQESGDCPDHL